MEGLKEQALILPQLRVQRRRGYIWENFRGSLTCGANWIPYGHCFQVHPAKNRSAKDMRYVALGCALSLSCRISYLASRTYFSDQCRFQTLSKPTLQPISPFANGFDADVSVRSWT
jgi:hypothetical protein